VLASVNASASGYDEVGVRAEVNWMLVAHASKRSGAEHFAADVRFDILAGEHLLGRLSCDRKTLSATIVIGGETFTVDHVRGAEEERLYEAAGRLATGRPKPTPDRFELKTADGRVLAVAEQAGETFQVTHGGRRFGFAKGRSRQLFDLCADGDPTPIGSVGQRKFWTTSMHMDLADAFDAPFQVFLLTVLLGLFMQRASRLTSST
jgi:hypothetical protein